MNKMTVSEYARAIKKSPTAIYQFIKSGKIRAEKIDGKTYVFVKNIETKEILEGSEQLLKLEVEMLKQLLKSKQSEIDTLNISLSAFSMLVNNRLSEKPHFEDAEVVSIKKKKKKKK